MSKKIIVGQKIYVVPEVSWLGEPAYAEVVKIGRKYAYIEFKTDLEQMTLKTWDLVRDGGDWVIGHCYPSKEAYQDFLYARKLATVFSRNLYPALSQATTEQIRQAAAILGIELEGKDKNED